MLCHVYRTFSGLLAFAALMAYAPPSHAQKIRTLTNENVKSFIAKTTQIIAGHAQNMADDEMMRYLEKHLHPEGRFKTVMKYNVPGYPAHEMSVSFNKSEFMDGIKRSESSVSDYSNNIQILDIKISGNAQVATVKSKNMESGIMLVAGDEENPDERVPIEGQSTCTQILAIHKGLIQMYHATCVTDIQFVQDY